jgi:peptidyl-prolyl cis-trans isomerase C
MLITVNGKAITKTLLDQLVALNVSQVQTVTHELRGALLDEPIHRELVAQDAVAKKLDKSAQARLQLQQSRQNVLIDLDMAHSFAKTPIDEAALRAEYQRQTSTLAAMWPSQHYQLRLLVVPTEIQARDAIQQINQGQSMEAWVKDASTDVSRNNGGLMDWLLSNQMLSGIANVEVNLSKGQITTAPIQTPSVWNVLQVENFRPFVIPKFEEALEQLRGSLVKQQRAAYMAQLRTSANISRPLFTPWTAHL